MLTVNKMSRIPIYEQIIEGIKREILKDVLKPNDMLPSVRELAFSLSTNPNTVQRAFAELEEMGVATSSPGIGRYVSENAKEILQNQLKGRIWELEEIAKALKDGGISFEEAVEALKKGYEYN